MQCCLLIWFCSVVLSWATVCRLFGWAMRSSVWMNGLQGGQAWEMHIHMHPHTAPRYRCLIRQHKNSAVLAQYTPPPLHSPTPCLLSYSLSASFLITLLLAVCKFIHCENGRQLHTAQFHLVLYSVSLQTSGMLLSPTFQMKLKIFNQSCKLTHQ